LLEFTVGNADFRFVEFLSVGMNAEREKRAPDEWMYLCHARNIPPLHETMMKPL
jgi:hypothetical protein